MRVVDTDPDPYVATLPPDQQEALSAVDARIRSAIPDLRRVLWEGVFWGGSHQTIIGYGDLTQTNAKGEAVEWFIVGLARQKRNYSIYVNAVVDNKYIAHSYADRLGKVKLGAASIGFTKLEQLNLDVLEELLREAGRLTASP